MSITSLNNDLEGLFEHLMEQIEERVDSHGLDPDSEEVARAIDFWFGASVTEGWFDWNGPDEK